MMVNGCENTRTHDLGDVSVPEWGEVANRVIEANIKTGSLFIQVVYRSMTMPMEMPRTMMGITP